MGGEGGGEGAGSAAFPGLVPEPRQGGAPCAGCGELLGGSGSGARPASPRGHLGAPRVHPRGDQGARQGPPRGHPGAPRAHLRTPDSPARAPPRPPGSPAGGRAHPAATSARSAPLPSPRAQRRSPAHPSSRATLRPPRRDRGSCGREHGNLPAVTSGRPQAGAEAAAAERALPAPPMLY
ncbi:translation initiation factor IF-2-like [Orcinus orca]|uniref:translation initiation factor IF-2-like n=1 Tax=Orcinus orca TaxID=9733 RepID=UPI0014415008|nr:translation initiation factor IF-2-like [Orcinus orca]